MWRGEDGTLPSGLGDWEVAVALVGLWAHACPLPPSLGLPCLFPPSADSAFREVAPGPDGTELACNRPYFEHGGLLLVLPFFHICGQWPRLSRPGTAPGCVSTLLPWERELQPLLIKALGRQGSLCPGQQCQPLSVLSHRGTRVVQKDSEILGWRRPHFRLHF